jgi:hypothetical protein
LYDYEFETRGVLDDKGSNLIGYVTIVTGLLIGLGTFEIFDKLSLPEYYIPYFAGIALLLATIVFSMLSVRVKEYKFVPTVDALRKVVDDDNWDNRTIIRQFNTGAMKAIEENHLKNERKATWVSLSWGCLISGLVLITIYVSIIATHGKP